ncbi:ribose-5-phosphate isomerase RpiA [Bacillus sp. 1780r2a1]|uniref:ribose-5-phosphate isomerase RpiA n=1 Tax=Priestia flexa TaxID=86664 RepID=UPI002203F7EA|nr:ribose-5-phosphate isomerase RpiA [Priestia flexa]MDT2046827.1 ribose-5-phosphate isomerase RpiA [Priestia flexa]USY57032.1 ribose-5-phosphate isomerase RpiA [Bacillus sp. 1780r2a1]
MNEKQIIGEKAVDFVEDNMVVGLGTGSTVFYTIRKLGQLVKQGLHITGIPTSIQTEELAKKFGIPISKFEDVEQIDIAIDGADEVSSELDLLKGGGGALLREKIVAREAKTFIVVADSSKLVEKLGSFLLPVEVIPFGVEVTKKNIYRLGGNVNLRESKGKPFKTDNGNYILDCSFSDILSPKVLERELNMIPGVVENGLFVEMAESVITIGQENNVVIKKRI